MDDGISPFQKQLDKYDMTISPIIKSRAAIAMARIYSRDKKEKKYINQVLSLIRVYGHTDLKRHSFIYLRDQTKGLATKVTNKSFDWARLGLEDIRNLKENITGSRLMNIVVKMETFLDDLDEIITEMMEKYSYKPNTWGIGGGSDEHK